MAFSGLAFVNLFILTIVMCLPSPKFFLWDCVWGGKKGEGGGEEKREEGGEEGRRGEKREGGGWLCFCDKTSQTGFIA